jgi:hypothetical protein
LGHHERVSRKDGAVKERITAFHVGEAILAVPATLTGGESA